MSDLQGKNVSFDDNYKVDLSVAETSVLAVMLCAIMILDLVGNGTMAIVVLRNKRMWTETNMFMMNLVFGDMAVSLLSMPLPLITVIRREWIFERGPLCSLNAYSNSLFFVATIFTHTTISIDRYMACVKPMHKIITKKKAAFMITGVWILAALISSGPLLGWGRMDYNASALQCGFGFPKNKFETSYILLLALIAFIMPICIMTFAYIKIYIAVRQSTRRISKTTFGRQRQNNVELQKKIVLTFFSALIAFIVCWAPFFVFIAVAADSATRQNIPKGLGVAAYWCGFLNSACNPFIIGLRIEQFRKAFRTIFCWPINLYKKRRNVEGENSSSQNISTQAGDLDNTGKTVRSHKSLDSLPLNEKETFSSFVSLSNVPQGDEFCDEQPVFQMRFDSLAKLQMGEEESQNVPHRMRKIGRGEENFGRQVFLYHSGNKFWRETGV